MAAKSLTKQAEPMNTENIGYTTLATLAKVWKASGKPKKIQRGDELEELLPNRFLALDIDKKLQLEEDLFYFTSEMEPKAFESLGNMRFEVIPGSTKDKPGAQLRILDRNGDVLLTKTIAFARQAKKLEKAAKSHEEGPDLTGRTCAQIVSASELPQHIAVSGKRSLVKVRLVMALLLDKTTVFHILLNTGLITDSEYLGGACSNGAQGY